MAKKTTNKRRVNLSEGVGIFTDHPQHDVALPLIDSILNAANGIADAITPASAGPGHDAHGGYVTSLTEAVMGVTKSLQNIADAITSLAEAVRESRDVN